MKTKKVISKNVTEKLVLRIILFGAFLTTFSTYSHQFSVFCRLRTKRRKRRRSPAVDRPAAVMKAVCLCLVIQAEALIVGEGSKNQKRKRVKPVSCKVCPQAA
jgi:hypothetical protein